MSSAIVLVMANKVSRNSITTSNSNLRNSMISSYVMAVFRDSLMGNAIMCRPDSVRTLARCISRSEYFGRGSLPASQWLLYPQDSLEDRRILPCCRWFATRGLYILE